ncbi:hypothetical protein EPN87_02820 [archaeon]|nr:MAG: hypothetical protein EPN87_02820 [archaeon]
MVDEARITNRIAMIALLAAIILGTISVYKDQKFDISGNSQLPSLVISSIAKSLVIPLLIFVIYIMGLSMDYRHDSTRTSEWYHPFYDLGVALSFFVVVFAIVVVLVLKLAVYFNSVDLGVIGIWGGLAIVGLIFSNSVYQPLKSIICNIVKQLKWFVHFLEEHLDC